MKVGRNDPCPCGSGKKYKNCCLNASYYEALYNNQMELLSQPTIDNCQRVINLGNTILEASEEYVFSTGASTNIARANLLLLYKTKDVQFLDATKKFCDKALKLKPDNQQALLILYEINIFNKDFGLAGLTLQTIDPSIVKKAEEQILMFYQQVINEANVNVYSQEAKDGLNKLTNTLFQIYGNDPALCGIAVLYYMGIGNDVITAYEVAKKCIDVWPNSETYCSLGLICITPPLNRVKDAIMYLKKGLELCRKKDLEDGLKSNLLPALIKDKNWPEAIKLGEELIKEKPSNLNYHNYAELLKHLGRYDEAAEWCKKALFLVEDDCSLLSLADIYKRNQNYEDAIKTYLLCLSSQDANTNALTFIDENGSDLYSIASDSAIDGIKLEAFKGLIQSHVQLKSYKKAKAFLVLGKELLGDNENWDVWDSIIPTLEDFSSAYEDVKKEVEAANNQTKTQKNYFKQWASTLMQLQGNSQQIDLNLPDNWSAFETQMNLVLDEMKKSIINHSALYSEMKTQVVSLYPHLDADSMEFLITANILYDIHQNSFIDFAPIIVEYAKVVEKRLRILLAGILSPTVKMLGSIIGVIENQSIAPYNSYLNDLKSVNNLRKNSAHVGRLSKVDADAMRTILLVNGLINRL